MNKGDPYLHQCGDPSSFISSMERVFGFFPCDVMEKDIPTLRGMSAVYGQIKDNPYDELIEILDREKHIQLYAEY